MEKEKYNYLSYSREYKKLEFWNNIFSSGFVSAALRIQTSI